MAQDGGAVHRTPPPLGRRSVLLLLAAIATWALAIYYALSTKTSIPASVTLFAAGNGPAAIDSQAQQQQRTLQQQEHNRAARHRAISALQHAPACAQNASASSCVEEWLGVWGAAITALAEGVPQGGGALPVAPPQWGLWQQSAAQQRSPWNRSVADAPKQWVIVRVTQPPTAALQGWCRLAQWAVLAVSGAGRSVCAPAIAACAALSSTQLTPPRPLRSKHPGRRPTGLAEPRPSSQRKWPPRRAARWRRMQMSCRPPFCSQSLGAPRWCWKSTNPLPPGQVGC